MKAPKQNGNMENESAPTIKTPSLPPAPGEIRQRAYDLFLARGGAPGKELDDWLLAEQQLCQEQAKAEEPAKPASNH